MGRWAQTQRTGGGPPILNYILRASMPDTTHVDLVYAQAVNATAIPGAGFVGIPSGTPGIANAQTGTHTTQVTLLFPSGGDTGVTYSGTTPGILTPQTVGYT